MKSSKLRNEKGQALVEFVMVLPVLLFLFFAIVQLGVVFKDYIAVTDAARAGARKAAVSRFAANPTAATADAVRASAAGLDPDELQVDIDSTWAAGNDVVVTASYPYSVDILGLVVTSGRLTSSTTERVE